MTIPLVDLAAQMGEIDADLAPDVAQILASAAFISGPHVASFEREYAAYCEVDHCVSVGNGTDAVELALRALDVAGGEVIVPANTFIATAEGVVRAGARPVLVDCDPDTLLIDPDQAGAAVTPHTRAVVPVHLFGQAAPVERVTDLLAGTGVHVVEDAAQSQGATRHGSVCGGLGEIAATSFYPGKNLGAAGDAGAVTTHDEALAHRVRLLANHGSVRRYVHEVVGFNSRMDALQAAVLRHKLRRLDAWNTARRAAAARYDDLLDDLATAGDVRLPVTAPGNEHVWHLYVVRVPRRDAVLRGLHELGIGAAIHYPQPLHRTAAFAHLAPGDRGPSLRVSEQAADEILSLPMYPHLSADQQEQVVAALVQALAGSRAY